MDITTVAVGGGVVWILLLLLLVAVEASVSCVELDCPDWSWDFVSPACLQDVFSHMFETEQQDATIVLLSDVWLDRTLVLQKLDFIFRVYEEEMVIPKMFIFMGSFLSYKFGSSYQDRYMRISGSLVFFCR